MNIEPSTEIAILNLKIEELESKVDKLTNSVADLVDAWKAANNLLRFIKWASGVAATIATIWAIYHSK